MTVVSAPPESVSMLHDPLKVSHEPFVSVAESRSTTSVVASRPEPPSLPVSIASGTESDEYHGPPASATDWPAGAVVSLLTVKVAVAVEPAPFVTVTVWLPEAAVLWSHVYEDV